MGQVFGNSTARYLTDETFKIKAKGFIKNTTTK